MNRGVIGIFLIITVIFLAITAVFLTQPSHPPVIVKNEVVLPRGPGEYMEVRHIVVLGTNEEIGRALGDIAQKDYGTRLDRYPTLQQATARNQYIRTSYPVLYERMKGVAASYGLGAEDTLYDTGSLSYGLLPAGCSIIYFPGNVTGSGHAMYSRNMDYFTATAAEIFGGSPTAAGERMCSKNYVLELYPDSGYPSIVIGSFDLLNAPLDGMNAQGVTVSMLVDNDAAGITVSDLSQVTGLSTMQLMRAVLDTAADVNEAKRIIRGNNVTMVAVPLHMLIADRSGSSFVAEMSGTDLTWKFTDNHGNPQVLTNHALWKYPDPGTFPDVPASDAYDTFNRYQKLQEYITGHEGLFSTYDARSSMALVYADTELGIEGGSKPLPMRTVWTTLFDLEDRSVQVQFYLHDQNKDPAADNPGLVFSPLFTFRLDNTTTQEK
jgi:predicted choloylglycine hydrolase